MTHENIPDNEKDQLITIIKKALELACMRLATWEGSSARTADPEEWIRRAYLLPMMSGWEQKK